MHFFIICTLWIVDFLGTFIMKWEESTNLINLVINVVSISGVLQNTLVLESQRLVLLLWLLFCAGGPRGKEFTKQKIATIFMFNWMPIGFGLCWLVLILCMVDCQTHS